MESSIATIIKPLLRNGSFRSFLPKLINLHPPSTIPRFERQDADSLAVSVRPRRSHAHRDANFRGGVDQPVEGVDVVAHSQPANLTGREAELLGCFEVIELELGDPADDLVARLCAQGDVGRLLAMADASSLTCQI